MEVVLVDEREIVDLVATKSRDCSLALELDMATCMAA